MATHSSVLAWRIPGTEEPGRRPSMGSHRVRHDWSDLAAAAAACRSSNLIPALSLSLFFYHDLQELAIHFKGWNLRHWRKKWHMTNLESILKSRNITLLTKVCIGKAMIFPVIMYRCENWTIKKAECQKIVAFKLWCWRRLLRVPWRLVRSNQSIRKEINLKYSLEGLMLKLRLQYSGHLMGRANHWKRPWCWERLKAGGEGDDRGWDSWMASPIQWTWVWANSSRSEGQGSLAVLQSMG